MEISLKSSGIERAVFMSNRKEGRSSFSEEKEPKRLLLI
jgi:hypothetical protein